jgi:hypothetical protein
MGLRETSCEDINWIKVAYDYVQWEALVLLEVNSQILLLVN